MTITMPHITDDPKLLLDPTQITAALKAAVIYRVTESTSKDGVYTREITANDGRYDGDKKEEIARLRKTILKIEDEKRALTEEKRVTDADNAKLLCENNQYFNAVEAKDKKLSDVEHANKALKKENEKLRQEKRDMKSQLDKTKRDLQSRTDRSRDQDIYTDNLKDQIAALKNEVSKGADQQNTINALKTKLIMSGKSCEAMHAEKKLVEDALTIAEHALANSRVAVNPTPTNESQTQTDPERTDTGIPQVQDSTEPSLSKTTPQTYARVNCDITMTHESTKAPKKTTADEVAKEAELQQTESIGKVRKSKSKCLCDEPNLYNFCNCLRCGCSFRSGVCQKKMKPLEFMNVTENSKEDENAPVPRMMTASEYEANQLALQRKAGLAKSDARSP